jgi:hypothetical protein
MTLKIELAIATKKVQGTLSYSYSVVAARIIPETNKSQLTRNYDIRLMSNSPIRTLEKAGNY